MTAQTCHCGRKFFHYRKAAGCEQCVPVRYFDTREERVRKLPTALDRYMEDVSDWWQP